MNFTLPVSFLQTGFVYFCDTLVSQKYMLNIFAPFPLGKGGGGMGYPGGFHE